MHWVEIGLTLLSVIVLPLLGYSMNHLLANERELQRINGRIDGVELKCSTHRNEIDDLYRKNDEQRTRHEHMERSFYEARLDIAKVVERSDRIKVIESKLDKIAQNVGNG